MRIVEMVRNDIKNSSLLKTKFLIYAFNGRTFFVFDKLGLIAYPHDDTGFGFIRIRNTKVHYEDMFLKDVSQFSDFISVW